MITDLQIEELRTADGGIMRIHAQAESDRNTWRPLSSPSASRYSCVIETLLPGFEQWQTEEEPAATAREARDLANAAWKLAVEVGWQRAG